MSWSKQLMFFQWCWQNFFTNLNLRIRLLLFFSSTCLSLHALIIILIRLVEKVHCPWLVQYRAVLSFSIGLCHCVNVRQGEDGGRWTAERKSCWIEEGSRLQSGGVQLSKHWAPLYLPYSYLPPLTLFSDSLSPPHYTTTLTRAFSLKAAADESSCTESNSEAEGRTSDKHWAASHRAEICRVSRLFSIWGKEEIFDFWSVRFCKTKVLLRQKRAMTTDSGLNHDVWHWNQVKHDAVFFLLLL